MTGLSALLQDIRACRKCEDRLPRGPRPIIQLGKAKITIAAQAPGTRVHETGVPFNDPSGDRLRDWMGVDHDCFYDPDRINIVPMGFCYPGQASSGSGDAPPDPECRKTWHDQVFSVLGKQDLMLVIGQYAQAYHLGARRKATLTETVKSWRDYAPDVMVLPHPSPRNNIWLAKNPWFETDVLPQLRIRVKQGLGA